MKRGLETYLYSTVGVIAVLVILVAVNVIGAHTKQRIDLTADHAFTLSDGTRHIVSKLDTPVQVRFYCSRSEAQMPVALKTYADRVEDLLNEYRQLSKGLIEIQKLDPAPDSDAEDSARLDGIQPTILPDGANVYFGMSITMLDAKENIPFLNPEQEPMLEYEVSRAITRVANPDKPVIGVMSPLPVAGQSNPMMAQMGRRPEPAWTFYSKLKSDFDVKTVEMTAEKIPDEIKVLVLIHPKGLSDAAQFAIDQFILKGGKLVAFLDPMAVIDGQSGMGRPSSSNLDKLLAAWGLHFDSSKVVADMDHVGRTPQGRNPTVLILNQKAMSKEDPLTAQTDNLPMILVGAFTGTPAEGLKESVLIKSSKNSELVDSTSARVDGEGLIKDFHNSGTEYALAVRLAGKFKTAFPDGKPKADLKKPNPKKPEDKKPDQPEEPALKESTQDSSVILVGDSDMIEDQVAVRVAMNPFTGQRTTVATNGNLAFAQGTVEQMAGDNDLIAMRSRGLIKRPFTVVTEMQAAAEAKNSSKRKELEDSLAEAQRKINELQSSKNDQPGQRFILSPEQQQEIANFRAKVGDVKKQIRLEQKKLHVETDALENRVKWLNIAGMPLVVSLLGVALALHRRSRQAAR